METVLSDKCLTAQYHDKVEVSRTDNQATDVLLLFAEVEL
jgi:hypothetical protein